MAEKSSISVFAENLRKLLLTAPIRGKCILGVDPGFFNGCKFALISPTGMLLNLCYVLLNVSHQRLDLLFGFESY